MPPGVSGPTTRRALTLAAIVVGIVAIATETGTAASSPATVLAVEFLTQSTTRDLVGSLNAQLLLLSIPLVILVEGVLVYAVLKFRGGDAPKPTVENRRLELSWTIATAVLLVFVAVTSYGVMADPAMMVGDGEIAPDEDDVHVHFEAYQWGWDVTYPGEGIDAPSDEVVLPVDADVYVTVTSRDVIHGFHVPELALKIDALPGQENAIKTTTTETGTFQGYCSEYCGTAHSAMYFEIVVVDREEYEGWVERRGA